MRKSKPLGDCWNAIRIQALCNCAIEYRILESAPMKAKLELHLFLLP